MTAAVSGPSERVPAMAVLIPCTIFVFFAIQGVVCDSPPQSQEPPSPLPQVDSPLKLPDIQLQDTVSQPIENNANVPLTTNVEPNTQTLSPPQSFQSQTLSSPPPQTSVPVTNLPIPTLNSQLQPNPIQSPPLNYPIPYDSNFLTQPSLPNGIQLPTSPSNNNMYPQYQQNYEPPIQQTTGYRPRNEYLSNIFTGGLPFERLSNLVEPSSFKLHIPTPADFNKNIYKLIDTSQNIINKKFSSVNDIINWLFNHAKSPFENHDPKNAVNLNQPPMYSTSQTFPTQQSSFTPQPLSTPSSQQNSVAPLWVQQQPTDMTFSGPSQ